MDISKLSRLCEGFLTAYPGLKNTSRRIDDTEVWGMRWCFVVCKPPTAPYRPIDLANREIMEAESHTPMIGCHVQDMCTDTSAMRRHTTVHITLGWKSRRVLLCGFLPTASLWISDPALANQAPGMLVELVIGIRLLSWW
jgi:hypothetical protein